MRNKSNHNFRTIEKSNDQLVEVLDDLIIHNRCVKDISIFTTNRYGGDLFYVKLLVDRLLKSVVGDLKIHG